MERIQQAIAKARSQRLGAMGQSSVFTVTPSENASPHPRSRQGVMAQRPAGGYTPTPSLLTGIEYKQTRIEIAQPEHLSRHRVIAHRKGDARADIYRRLRTELGAKMAENDWKTLAITSPSDGAGKTVTAVNLALSLSEDVNQTVLLVDLDLRTPAVHRTLGLSVDKGVTDCVLNNEPLENVLINPGFARLVVLPGRSCDAAYSELLCSPNMKALLHDITNRYASRRIIFDLPPLFRDDDALVFAPQADATLLVVEDQVTTTEQLKRSQQLLQHSNLIGSILNKARG